MAEQDDLKKRIDRLEKEVEELVRKRREEEEEDDTEYSIGGAGDGMF